MLRNLKSLGFLLAVVLFSYGAANAQIVDVTKKVVDKTKDVTVDAAKKTVEVTKDAANAAKDATVDATVKAADVTSDAIETTREEAPNVAEKTVSGSKKVGGFIVETTGDIAEKTVETGKNFTVLTWDGTKWVAKQVWFPAKKTTKAVVNKVN